VTLTPLTIGIVLQSAKQQLAETSASASLDAQVLLGEVLGLSRAQLIAYPERELTTEQADHYTALIERRAQGEPVAYLLGRKPFYDRELIVTPEVLIPRPETELLLEWALEIADQEGVRSVVDVGTGSGALAVTFAALRPEITVYATDISPAALAVARRNAEAQGAKVTFFEGDLLQPLIDNDIQVELVIANLPYIARDEVPTLEVSRYEPVLALDGGADGLDLIRQLVIQAPQVCRPGASLLLEIGADQGEALQAFDEWPQVENAQVRRDYAGLDRLARLRLLR
jgi:release factor glutamine methyltransferase